MEDLTFEFEEGKQLAIPLKFVTLRVRNKTVKTWPSSETFLINFRISVQVI